jgi:peptidoglycan/xylan/chitin deacetylase (PgdA/CDA1 family)
MDVIRATCAVSSLSDVLSSTANPRSSRPRVLLTFDDGYLNFRDVVWPALVERGLPATLYVPVGFINGKVAPIRGTMLPACSWEDLRALVSEGVSIGSHTVNHPNLTTASADAVESELRDSRAELEQRLGIAVTSFCYPQAKWNGRVAGMARRYYESAVCAGGRRFVSGSDEPHRIPRFPVRRDLGSFEAMLRARVWIPEAIADLVRQRRP